MYNPSSYEKYNYLSRRDNYDFTQEFSNEIGKMSGRCLDIGSGPGDTVIDIIFPKLQPNATIVCSDISEPMVNYGRKKYADNHRISFMKLNIEQSDLPIGLMQRFDHVTSFYCVHWCQDMRQVFKNIFDLLRPEGTALVSFLIDFPTSLAYRPLAAMPRYQPYMEDVDRFIPVYQHVKSPRESLNALLNDVGFKVLHCSLREKTHVYDNPDDMGEFMLTVNPFIERIPAALRMLYKRDLVNEVVKRSIVIDKNIHNKDDYKTAIRYHAFFLHLRKPAKKLHD